MNKWQRCISGACFILIAAFLFVGCYTVLRHPQIESNSEAETYECATCHADADLYHFRDPFLHSGGYYDREYSPWYGYYVVPWWYDGYWYYPQDGEEGSQVRSGDGRLWDRGSHPDQAPIPRIGSAPPSDQPAQPSAESGKKEEEKKDEKKKRRLWGRGK
ncbi:MAG: hypothetical protein KJ970_06680 [Candidatus Eisenbacteria bacterium]|uniref:Lipoprotein n=1 Tax=Eiseniibacteriota bacterium TaxID=2212470 RepID=A0A948RW12_UNCEI|nr:hypothetical protein [Candidatus Eisenbacteria bacterium]MBU1948916.1 hypothetical protein [Candidatus Eisenbacteria bacterium]MBU2690598.1 hypothetical protein [Candidatus Eisenbacteria bacterium]